VRAEAVTRLARLHGIAALSDVTRALEDPAAPVRLAAVRAAATLDPEAVAALRSVAGNDSSDAARAAIAALSLMGREAHAVLTEMAAEHPDEGMRLLSRIAIGQPIGDRH
jgi:HEAT repeat protein